MTSAGQRPRVTHEVDVRSGAVRVTLAGEFDLSTEAELAGWLSQAILDHPGTNLEVDMHNVSFLDSSGIRALLKAYGVAVREGVGMRLVRARGTVREVLEIVDVYEMLTGQQPASN